LEAVPRSETLENVAASTTFPKEASLSASARDRELDRYLTDAGNAAALCGELESELERRQIFFGKSLLPSFPKPDLVDWTVDRAAGQRIEKFVSIIERLGRQLALDGDLRRAVRCPPGVGSLFEIDPGYSRVIVNSRLDMTGPETLRLFEINTDSPAMMTYTDHLEEIVLSMSPVAERLGVAPVRHRLTRVLLSALVDTYHEWGGVRRDPLIAIVDWKGQKTASELLHTAAVFTELGCPTIVCDPGELSIRNGKLCARDRQIDIVQRRVLFPDFLRRATELEALLEAYRRGLVCVVNSLRAITVGNKAAMALLFEHPDICGLDADEIGLLHEVLPETITVNPQTVEQLCADKDSWVIKRSLSSGGVDVIFGCERSQADWEQVVARAVGDVVVAQRKQSIPVRRLPVVENGAVELRTLFANWNPWVFGGRYAGASTRVSTEKVISITAGGGLLPAVPV
jgi:hypothetical protein